MSEQLQPKSFFKSKYVYALTAVILVQAVLFYSASRGEIIPVAAPLAAFPGSVGDWLVAREEPVDNDTREILRADDLLSRTYVNQNMQAGAHLFVAYFKTQRTGQAPHSPKNCLPGAGWQPSESGKIDLSVGNDTIRVNHYLVSRGDEASLVLYWYQSQGRVIADEFAAKYYLVAGSIKNHRSDTALVRVVVNIPPGQTAHAEEVGRKFVQDVYPAIRSYLPS